MATKEKELVIAERVEIKMKPEIIAVNIIAMFIAVTLNAIKHECIQSDRCKD